MNNARDIEYVKRKQKSFKNKKNYFFFNFATKQTFSNVTSDLT